MSTSTISYASSTCRGRARGIGSGGNGRVIAWHVQGHAVCETGGRDCFNTMVAAQASNACMGDQALNCVLGLVIDFCRLVPRWSKMHWQGTFLG